MHPRAHPSHPHVVDELGDFAIHGVTHPIASVIGPA